MCTDLENVILSERSLTQGQMLFDSTDRKSTETEERVVGRGCVRREWRGCVIGQGSFWGEDVLQLDRSGGCTAL